MVGRVVQAVTLSSPDVWVGVDLVEVCKNAIMCKKVISIEKNGNLVVQAAVDGIVVIC